MHVCDVRDVDAVEAMIEAPVRRASARRSGHNAAGNFLARSEELSPRATDGVGIVLKGSVNCTLACGRRWLTGDRPGTVLSITTTYAWTGSAYVLPSAIAKAGVLAMTQSLAVEWGGRGVRLNAIAPGPFPRPRLVAPRCPRRRSRAVSRRAIRSAARASTASSPTSPLSCWPTGRPISTARW